MRQRGVDATTERLSDLEEVHEPAAPPTFAQVYAEAYLPMVRLGHLLTGSNEVGEEVTQEAFVRMYRRFDDVVNPGAYLRTAVLNGCRSWQRRQHLERSWIHREAPATVASGPTRGEMADVLAGLPFRQRAALVLRFYEDRSIEEIATALDCRPGTAKSHVSRGLERIRKVIER